MTDVRNIIITIIAVYRLNFSRIGRAWESIREDETAAELMGVNTFLLKLLANVKTYPYQTLHES